MKNFKKYKTPYRDCLIILSLFFTTLVSESSLTAQTQKSWQWVKQLGSSSWDISAGVICDSKNDLYVAGSFLNTLNSGSKSLEAYGNRDLFIAKFNEKGSLKELFGGGGEGNDLISCICVLPDDNLAVGGVLTGTVTLGKIKVEGEGKRLFVGTLDSKGDFTWITTISISGDASVDISDADIRGNIYIAGIYTGTLESQDQGITSNGKKDIFMASLNPSGKIMNLYSLGSEEDDLLGSMAVEKSGKIALAGTFGKPFETGGIKPVPGPKGTKTNAFIGKFDRDFKSLWINVLSGKDYCNVSSVKYDNFGNLYVAGSFNSNLYISDTILISNGYTDGFIIKYIKEGKPDWIRTFGSWYYDYATHLNVDNLGGAVITGSLGDTLSIDSLSVEPVSKNNSALVIQFSSKGEAIWAEGISGSGRNFSDGSVLDKEGNLYFTGAFRNEFEEGDKTLTSFGDQDIFLAKYYNCTISGADISGDRSFCPGSGTELSIKRSYSNIVWNDTIPAKYSITADKPGLYWVRMLDKKGCLVTDTIEISQNPAPVFSLGNDTTILVTDSLILEAPGNYISYWWHDSSIEPEYLAKPVDMMTGTKEYWLTITDSLLCIYTDTISVTYLKDYDWIDLETTKLFVYPNPASNRVFWYLQTDEICRLEIEITDERGRKIYHQDINQYLPGEEREIYLGNMPSGIYNIRVRNSSFGIDYKTVSIMKH